MRARLAAIALPLLVMGCSGGTDENLQDVYPVSGVVTQFNKPLADATVAFAASDPNGKQPTAIGRTDKDGRYELTTYEFADGAAEGKYKVTISKVAMKASTSGGDEHGDDVDAGADHGGGSGAATEQSLVPEQYSSFNDTPLNADVKKDSDNAFDFKIE